MSLVASVVDGEIVYTTASSTSLSSSSSSDSSSSLDKEDFLQLLVAQMKYQDPLEPTSNTEYISQFAAFSELEQMQNVSSSVDLARASSLVGQEVIMKVTSSSTGESSYISGTVDYVVIEDDEAYLSIDESLYSIDDLDTIVNSDYLEAYNLASEVDALLEDLPTVANLTLDEEDSVEELLDLYDSMTDYQKTFVASDNQESIEEYREKLEELLLTESEETEDDTTDETSDSDDDTTEE